MGESGRGDRRSPAFAWQLAGAAVVGAALRVVYVLKVAPAEPGADALWYQLVSGTLASGDGYVDPASFYGKGLVRPTATFPPLWPLTLSVAQRLGIDGLTGLRLVGAAFGMVTVVLAGLLGRRVAGARVGVVAALLVAAGPLLIAADGSLMSEPLFVCLVTAAVLVAHQALTRPTVGRVAALGVLAGAAGLTRSEGIVVGVALIGVVAWRAVGLPARRRLGLLGVGVGLVVATLAPWTVRNLVQLDEVVPLSTNSGSLVEGANCQTTYGGPLLGTWDFGCLTAFEDGSGSAASANTSLRNGVTFARDHASRLPVVAGARLLRTWGVWDPRAQADVEAVESRSRRWQIPATVVGLAVTACAAAGLVVAVREKLLVSPLVTVVVVSSATAVLAWGNQRFRLGAETSVAVLAAVALCRAATALWSTRTRRQAGGQVEPVAGV